MTLRRLLIGATLGMLLTGLVAYSVTPPASAPIPPPVADASPPERPPLDDEELARLLEEVERLPRAA